MKPPVTTPHTVRRRKEPGPSSQNGGGAQCEGRCCLLGRTGAPARLELSPVPLLRTRLKPSLLLFGQITPEAGGHLVRTDSGGSPTLPVTVASGEPWAHYCHNLTLYMLSCLSRVRFCATIRAVAGQAPLSMGFSRQDYWRGLPFPSPGNLPDLGIKPASPAWAGRFFIIGATS